MQWIELEPSVKVTWCFMPSQPLRLYQGESIEGSPS